MKKAFLFFCFCLVTSSFFSQTLSRQVFSTMGGAVSTDQVYWSYTLGQPEYTTTDSTTSILTQGFEQPDDKKNVMYEEVIPDCDHGQGVSLLIDVLEVCGDLDSEVIFNNQTSGELIENVLPGSYEVEVICGETNTFFLNIEIAESNLPECEIEFYNAIAPNGTEENQIWYIENIDLEDYQNNTVEIFDRWGNSVWNGTNYNNDTVVWNGTNNNSEELNQGTYYYIVTFDNMVFKGFIELIK